MVAGGRFLKRWGGELGENLYGQLGNGRGVYKNYPPAEGEYLVPESSNKPVFVKRPE